MKSNVHKIEKGHRDLDAILKESEMVADYNHFTHKQALQLRLICEEMDGMLPKIIDDFKGEFWIEYENGECKVNLSVELAEFTAAKKKELISVAKNKKNAAAMGIVGKIRSLIEDCFLDNETTQYYDMSSGFYHMATEYSVGIDHSYLWSLGQYKTTVKKENREEAWDELEKSIIASIADDVIVGVKGRQVNITIIKKFA
jgi:hypothetical protein